MLYNDLITYNQANITYNGTLIINVDGIQNPIILNNVTVYFGINEDYSNATTIATLTIDYASTGIITLDVLDDQIAVISQSIASAGESGILTINVSSNQAAIISDHIDSSKISGEITFDLI